MKIVIALFVGLLFFTFGGEELYGQKRKITVILIRHAEKDLSDAESSEPSLSAEGRLRAERFARLIKKYKPRRIYSTDYRRTRDTVAPLAEKRKIQVQTYDARKQNELVSEILSFRKGRRVVVVGHSNSIPALANLIFKEDKYKNLAESEYDKIWIIRIKKGKVKAKIIKY